MPIYEYICDDCQVVFEMLRAMSLADDPIDCTACGSEQTRRKPSICFSESGGKAIAGGSSSNCGSCTAGSCAGCGS